MTKNQKIKRLEDTVKKLGDLLAVSISFPDYRDDIGRNVSYYNKPLHGWRDPRIQALLKHLGIAEIQEEPSPSPGYKVILYPKKKSTRTKKEE